MATGYAVVRGRGEKMSWLRHKRLKIHEPYLTLLLGISLIIATYSIILSDSVTIAGGDLGLSVSHAPEFYELTKYTWNHFSELGCSNMGIFWYPYYLFIKIVSYITNVKMLTIIFFCLPLIISFSFIFLGVNKILCNSILALLAGLIFIFNPLSSRVYVRITLHPTYSVLTFSAFFIYLYFSFVFSSERRKVRNLLLATILVVPFSLTTFSNPAYGMPVIAVGIGLIILAVVVSGKKTISDALIPLLTFTLVSAPYILTFPSLSSSVGSRNLPTDPNYIIHYVRVESNAVRFFENFLPVSGEDVFVNILVISSSILLLFIAFAVPAINLNKLSRRLQATYLFGAFLFVSGVFLSKGISPPLSGVNEFLYKLLAPYSFAFRSPFSKFPIITISGLLLCIAVSLKCLERNMSGKRKCLLRQAFALVIIAAILLQNVIVVRGYLDSKHLLEDSADLELLSSLAKIRSGLEADGRVLLFPVNYGAFSTYNTSSSYYRGAPNEFLLFKMPVVVSYQWGRNSYLKGILSSLGTNDDETLLKLIKLGNIKYIVFIPYKESDNCWWDDKELFNKLVEYAKAECRTANNVSLCRLPFTTSYFYIADEPRSGYSNSLTLWPSNNTRIVPITISLENVRTFENGSLLITIPRGVREGAVDFTLPYGVSLSPLKVKVYVSLHFSSPNSINLVFFGFKTKNGYITYLLPRPYTANYSVTLTFNDIERIVNYGVHDVVIRSRLSVWKKSQEVNETISVRVMNITLAVFRSRQNYRPVMYYEYLNPTLWKVWVNTTKPFMLLFAESFDPWWEARVYKDGKLVERVRSVPVYGVINGFRINEIGNLTIVIRYVPQDWFELGLKISAITFALCIFYLVWNWRRGRGDRWALWLEERLRAVSRRFRGV